MINPFEEDMNEDFNIDDIYDVIYSSLLTYYKNIFHDYRVIKKDIYVIVLKKIDDENYKFICSFNIDNDDKIEIYYNNNNKQYYQGFKLENNIESNKFKLYKNFKLIFDEIY
jgi:hypothetical protein